ncbi:MAG: glycosyltransferase family 39 protein, partial [Anaerolineaceae bacterium]|nr:glycosyltransferase family 39 protein [Anaerolineaceae bacterium]
MRHDYQKNVEPHASPPEKLLPKVVVVLLVLALVLVVLLPATPMLYPTPDTDTSIFMYIGQKIVQGQLPYRDLYDHKPPLIFYINALGLHLFRGSRWGIWIIELASLAAASLFGFAFLRRYFRSFTALVAIGAMLLNLAFVHQRGNLTEEYALPFQFAALFFLSQGDQTGKFGWRSFIIGCSLGMASTLKQPMAGAGVAIGIYLLLRYAEKNQWRNLIAEYLLIILGFVTVWAAWFVYFTAVGIFPQFWEAAFRYNFALSGIPLAKKVRALLAAFDLLFNYSIFFLAGALAWLGLFPYLIFYDRRFTDFLKRPIIGLGLVLGGLVIFWNGLFAEKFTLFENYSLYRISLI